MHDIEARLAVLEAKNAISELRSKYCWFTTRGDAAGILSLFTEDGIFQNIRGGKDGAPLVIAGKAALTEYFARAKPARRVPATLNEVTEVTGDTATGTAVMTNFTDEPFCGHYIDDFEKIDGVWKFKVRRFYTYWPIYSPAPDRSEA